MSQAMRDQWLTGPHHLISAQANISPHLTWVVAQSARRHGLPPFALNPVSDERAWMGALAEGLEPRR